jgi:hypothetical protein
VRGFLPYRNGRERIWQITEAQIAITQIKGRIIVHVEIQAEVQQEIPPDGQTEIQERVLPDGQAEIQTGIQTEVRIAVQMQVPKERQITTK